MIAKRIIFVEKKMILICDAKCHRAWGMNSRPKFPIGRAPINPGTYEGGCGKPANKQDRLNKWCARECERGLIVEDNEDFKIGKIK